MRHTRPPLLLLAALLSLAQCHHSDPDPATPESQLPQASQTGANTFGCLINGKAFTPEGNVGTSNLSLTYDPSWLGGEFNLRAYRVDDNRHQYVTIDAFPVAKAGTYSFLKSTGACRALYADTPDSSNGCSLIYSDQDVAYRSGALVITRFDTQAHIASGTFAFKLLKTGCNDTLNITQGRFDVRF